jgi:hypothetical protein
MPETPVRLRVRAYHVGFGDCVLLTFSYTDALADGRDQRHVLIDFGSTEYVPGGPRCEDIAQMIADDCSGGLDVIVLSHRHQDHIKGFGIKKSAAIIDALSPKLIVQPWTEAPDAVWNERGPAGVASRAFIANLSTTEDVLESIAAQLGALPASRDGRVAEARRLALDQLKNKAYVHYGADSKIERFVPGIRVTVLGPPTIAQHEEVDDAYARDHDEFWHLAGIAGARKSWTLGMDAPDAPSPCEPGPRRWLIERMEEQQIDLLLSIVRRMDDVLNNTSVILLIEAGTKKLLFPGDAQIENWQYALAQDGVGEMLRDVDLYKVGHHGSTNATPRAGLFGLWEADARALTSVMSSLPGKHGEDDTQVPQPELVRQLGMLPRRLFTTVGMEGEALTLEGDLASAAPFDLVDG